MRRIIKKKSIKQAFRKNTFERTHVHHFAMIIKAYCVHRKQHSFQIMGQTQVTHGR